MQHYAPAVESIPTTLHQHNRIAENGVKRYAFSHGAFVQKLRLQILPNDEEHREGFDVPTDFCIGDPNVHFQAAAAKPYEISGVTGKPEWDSLFGFILAGGAAKEEKRGEARGDGGKKRKVFNPGPTSMVVSWTVSHRRRGTPS